MGRGPTQLALVGPTEAPGAPGPGTEGADCAAGLLAGRDVGVDIWFCYRGSDTRQTFILLKNTKTNVSDEKGQLQLFWSNTHAQYIELSCDVTHAGTLLLTTVFNSFPVMAEV